MTNTGYGYMRTVALPFADAVLRAEAALKAEGFGVLCQIDIQAKLKEKLGVDFPRGSSDWKASVDQAFQVTNVTSDGKLDRLSLRAYKSRFGLSGSLVYLYAGGRFIRDQRADAPARTAADQLTALLRTNPGIKGGEFEDKAAALGIARGRSREFLNAGVLAGLVRRETGAQNAKRYTLETQDVD